jgi:hypothetical protein
MSKLAGLAVTAALLCTATSARADDGDEGPKDPSTALALSLGGTLASGALVAIGAASNNGDIAAAGVLSSLVTPSLGEWYAGKPVTLGLGLRAASALVFVVGADEAFKCFLQDDTCHNNNTEAGLLLLGGLAGYATGTIYDIATAKSTAREYNVHHLQLAPTYMRTPSGSATMGVGIAGTF